MSDKRDPCGCPLSQRDTVLFVSKVYNERSPVLSPLEAEERFNGLDVALWRDLEGVFPVRVTRSWSDRVDDPSDPLGRQVFPVASELEGHAGDIPDPVGEEQKMPVPWVVRKHEDRALLLVTRRCHLHCRYCFRRDLDGAGGPTPEELEKAITYLRSSGVREVILSGGDPLFLKDEQLTQIIESLRPAIPLIRIHTRAPITYPSRVSAKLVKQLSSHAPLWVVVHVNHPKELSTEVCEGLGRFVDAGIPVLNQSVLLRGVNDDVDTLTALSERLLELRVRPYYLHHPDAVPGSSSFWVGLEEGLELYQALRGRVSGIGLPQYVIDPPDGTGKIPVAEWVARSVSSA